MPKLELDSKRPPTFSRIKSSRSLAPLIPLTFNPHSSHKLHRPSRQRECGDLIFPRMQVQHSHRDLARFKPTEPRVGPIRRGQLRPIPCSCGLGPLQKIPLLPIPRTLRGLIPLLKHRPNPRPRNSARKTHSLRSLRRRISTTTRPHPLVRVSV